MFKRAYRLIIEPEKVWREIAGEAAEPRQIFMRYALPMMLIPAAAMVAKILLSRGQYITFSFVLNLLIGGIVNYILSAAALLFAAWLISLMAPYFGSKSEASSAVKIVAYSMTPVWLCSVFKVFPPLAVLSILGLYAAYLVYTGLPIVLNTPPEKNLPFAFSVFGLGAIILPYLSIIAGGLFYL
ncbi:hypothetical protein A2625_08005 [candidate division WOR-1 bacterium RIFCSPHIGHO2_01_FULL_53_15]|uniref:Yip1 domain-containing protein n=1 Tax=candidate division WOR-1 bacterium RIFCSPHIGHO2_01_FULL_53_15 TaxID=1802564 RepID=A0A1F4Q0G7_UNCSA|nr:MAG: hypothetical protein A2625_08005 [candidate division WOR-1 bacterium RIFCSPHIGHO2_01_FULL_53_15]OGC12650.1 MAG: hypothetical protein A3D23_02785 [candidate division WOR-1 bacterium RIFCSPHIGHO2_02_FULL_53_26]